jgi:hypothetical protein
MSGDSIKPFFRYAVKYRVSFKIIHCRETEEGNMIAAKNYGGFALRGAGFKRCNPDNSMATADRTLGFAGIIDITGVLDEDETALISVKVDNAAQWEMKSANFSGTGIDPAALTPANAASVLNACGFTGVTFSVDSDTNRLKVAKDVMNATHDLADEIQIKGKLAGLLDFGQCRKYGGNGVYWIRFMDDEVMSATSPNDMKEKEDIDKEGAMGGIDRITIAAKRLGASPVVTIKYKNNELRQLVQGGEYDPGDATRPAIYDPPSNDQDGAPLFTFQRYVPAYGEGTNTVEGNVGMILYQYYTCTGTEGETTSEAKSWASYSFNLNATSYNDPVSGKNRPVPREYDLTPTQWDVLDLANV